MKDLIVSPAEPRLEFYYEPLDRDSGQIRLLEIISYNADEPLSARLSVHDLEHKDTFNAISYTWGNGEATKDIFINGKTKKVTENCYYALEQACRHFPPEYSTDGTPIYLWIDSICIDQSNGREKNHQVMLMDRIYAQASKVLACVGAHQDNSEELAEVLKSARSFSETSTFAIESSEDPHWKREPDSTDIILRDWYWAPDFRDRTRAFANCYYKTDPATPRDPATFLRSYAHFVKRRYWTRLWIIPEVAASHRSDCQLEVLCGWDKFSKSDIMLIHCIADSARSHSYPGSIEDLIDPWKLFLSRKDELPFTFVMRRRLGKRIPVQDVFSDRFQFACSYPQDRVYGLLPLIEWPHGVPPVQPEYEQSTTFELAELLLSSSFAREEPPLISLKKVSRIATALEISHEIVETQAKTVAQHRLGKYAKVNYYLGWRPYSTIDINEAGQLTARLHHSWRGPNISSAINELGKETRELVKPLYVGSKIAAWLSNSARVGDLIVAFGRSLLVLRNDAPAARFIGQGLLEEKFEFMTSQTTRLGNDRLFYGLGREKHGCWCHCILELEPAEMLLLLCQDLNRDGSRNTQKMVQRLFTNISGAASLNDVKKPNMSTPNGDLVTSPVASWD